jgi:type I restriction enzyme M protein
MHNFREKANFIWSIADLLRGHYKQADYGKVILPFTVLRRLDIVLEPTKKQVLALNSPKTTTILLQISVIILTVFLSVHVKL